jgi:hypothetical protein
MPRKASRPPAELTWPELDRLLEKKCVEPRSLSEWDFPQFFVSGLNVVCLGVLCEVPVCEAGF